MDVVYVDKKRFHPIEIKWTSKIATDPLHLFRLGPDQP